MIFVVNSVTVSVVHAQLVMYLIENKMSSLSGRPQKIVVNILEETVNQGMYIHSASMNICLYGLWRAPVALCQNASTLSK